MESATAEAPAPALESPSVERSDLGLSDRNLLAVVRSLYGSLPQNVLEGVKLKEVLSEENQMEAFMEAIKTLIKNGGLSFNGTWADLKVLKNEEGKTLNASHLKGEGSIGDCRATLDQVTQRLMQLVEPLED